MRYFILNFFVFIFALILNSNTFAEMTLKKLIFDNTQPFHLKILEAIPENGKIQIGPENAKNTIIEFMDYFCGYCKKIHPELMELAKRRNDTRVIFLQHPILSESSKVIAEMVIAATYQNKGLEFHDELFSIKGSINQEKLEQVINKVGIDKIALGTDYPFPLGELEPGGLITNSSLSIDDKQKLLSQNALDWLGLENI